MTGISRLAFMILSVTHLLIEERGENMTNTNLLRKKIDESGYKLRFVASKLGITYQGFLKKINNETEFKASEMQILRELLNLTDAEFEQIFFYIQCGITIHII